ncbi:MAG TPA: group II intron reverse transcriptase/maturase, partial [Phycisphaerae bacterium]|nr:group II intron reverse transcriptase/maturase [Phycisphaerae bacterium]
MEAICQPGNLREAFKRVRANKGGPGIDGMTVDDLPAHLKTHVQQIKAHLRNGTYQPKPVRRKEIRKPGGGMRKLGIPTVVDRLVQQAVLQVLQAEWDQ